MKAERREGFRRRRKRQGRDGRMGRQRKTRNTQGEKKTPMAKWRGRKK
jgi:hypothetical protein